jgi:adenylylsulfate kinase-like enzyme
MTKYRKILVMGLPGSGKTTLATELVSRLNAVHFNADEVRRNINKDLGFSDSDRVEQATRMGWLCDQVTKAGAVAVADFICPTDECRQAFTRGGEAFIVWLDRTDACQYEDTNQLFSPPRVFDVRVTSEGSAKFWADQITGEVTDTVPKPRATPSISRS